MTEPHFVLPKVPIHFGGKERFLCYTNRSLKRLRDEQKIDALEAFAKGDILDVLPKLIWCGLIWAEKELPFQEIDDWFLDNGGLLQNEQWSLDIAEALTGKRPDNRKLSDPPPADGATS